MYMQAGRNRGWTVVTAVNESTSVVAEQPMEAEMPMPAPPVVMPPVVTPLVSMPSIMKPTEAVKIPKECQTLAMAYVEMQKWQELYEPEQGFSRGTIFTQLDLPFVGEGACNHE